MRTSTQVLGQLEPVEEIQVRSDGPLVGARLTVRGVLYERLVRDSLALVHGKSSQKAVCKLGRSCDIRNYAILNAVFTPFSM